MGWRYALGGRCAAWLGGNAMGRTASLGRWRLGLGSAARLGLGWLGPDGSWRCNRPRTRRGGLFVLLPVAAGMEPMGVGVLALQ